MKLINTLYLLLLGIACQAQVAKQAIPTLKQGSKIPLTIEDLQGVWKEGNRIRHDLYGDEEYETEIEYKHIYIEGNQIWEFEYPFQMYTMCNFFIKNDSIKISSHKYIQALDLYEPELKMGEAFEYQYGLDSTKNRLCFQGACYYRDNLNIRVINKLKNGKFNRDSLAQNWKLKTFYDSGYDGLGLVYYVHPWELPANLDITKSNMYRFYYDKKIYLKIDGIKRPFLIDEVHSDSFSSKLVLVPDTWYEEPEEDPDEDLPFIGVHTSRVIYMVNDPDIRD